MTACVTGFMSSTGIRKSEITYEDKNQHRLTYHSLIWRLHILTKGSYKTLYPLFNRNKATTVLINFNKQLSMIYWRLLRSHKLYCALNFLHTARPIMCQPFIDVPIIRGDCKFVLQVALIICWKIDKQLAMWDYWNNQSTEWSWWLHMIIKPRY